MRETSMTCPIRINDAVAHRTMRSTFTAGDGSPNGRDECALLERVLAANDVCVATLTRHRLAELWRHVCTFAASGEPALVANAAAKMREQAAPRVCVVRRRRRERIHFGQEQRWRDTGSAATSKAEAAANSARGCRRAARRCLRGFIDARYAAKRSASRSPIRCRPTIIIRTRIASARASGVDVIALPLAAAGKRKKRHGAFRGASFVLAGGGACSRRAALKPRA
nr:hypothetical protein [Burkholderia ubonensis]